RGPRPGRQPGCHTRYSGTAGHRPPCTRGSARRCRRRPRRSRARTGSCCTGSGKRGTSGNPTQFLEPVGCAVKGVHLLRKGETDLPAAALGVQVETAPWHGGEPDVAPHAGGGAPVAL